MCLRLHWHNVCRTSLRSSVSSMVSAPLALLSAIESLTLAGASAFHGKYGAASEYSVMMTGRRFQRSIPTLQCSGTGVAVLVSSKSGRTFCSHQRACTVERSCFFHSTVSRSPNYMPPPTLSLFHSLPLTLTLSSLHAYLFLTVYQSSRMYNYAIV